MDEILECVNVDRKVLFGLLFEMQKKNEIICLPGNYYVKSFKNLRGKTQIMEFIYGTKLVIVESSAKAKTRKYLGKYIVEASMDM